MSLDPGALSALIREPEARRAVRWIGRTVSLNVHAQGVAAMVVGVLKEIKAEENRVAMTPSGVEVTQRNGEVGRGHRL